jgi:hypothetical protein
MNRVRAGGYSALFLIVCLGFPDACATAEKVRLSGALTTVELRCLGELLQKHFVSYPSASEIAEIIAKTAVGKADLNGDGRKEFIYLISHPGYCGSAGCWILIGERRQDGKCHILDSGNGDDGQVFVSKRRDHGYRRLYTPCEIYFNGNQYQQVREECPNAIVHR